MKMKVLTALFAFVLLITACTRRNDAENINNPDQIVTGITESSIHEPLTVTFTPETEEVVPETSVHENKETVPLDDRDEHLDQETKPEENVPDVSDDLQQGSAAIDKANWGGGEF